MEISSKTVTYLKPTNLRAVKILLVPTLTSLVALVCIFSGVSFWFWVGQVILSFFFLQTFILLHECGHHSFFYNKWLNIIFGNVFGFLSFIPFYTWRHMHFLHHRWTGWRDKDPTTEKTLEPSSSAFLRIVSNVAWFLFIPLFFLSYMLSNYWNLWKTKRFLRADKQRLASISVVSYLVIYIILIVLFGSVILNHFLPAIILSFILKELVILTQHSHVEIPISGKREVKPITPKDQVPFTRSFYVNSFFDRHFLFNFNLHEAHHAYPRLPCYYLHDVNLNTPAEPSFLSWFFKAKSMKGEDYVFRTSKQTGKVF